MIKFSTFKNRYQKEPKMVEFPLEDFIQGMTTPVSYKATEKNKLPLWSPTLFNGNRSATNAEFLTCLVYDVDDGLTPFSAWQLFSEWVVIAHTSFSCTPQVNKYRIILPLGRVIPASDWDLAHEAALELWNKVVGRGEPDLKALKDRGRMYYRFALPDSDLAPNNPLHPHNYHNADGWDGGYKLVLDYSHIKRPEKKKSTYKRGEPIEYDDLLLEASARSTIAHSVNATITGNRAHHIPCPHCHDNSVFFFIDISTHPNPQKGWRCNHFDSCKAYGHLSELI